MNEDANDGSVGAINSVKKYKKPGFIVIALCVLACKIPLIITLVGLGGLSTAVSYIPLPPMIKTVVLNGAMIGMLLITGYLFYRVFAKIRP